MSESTYRIELSNGVIEGPVGPSVVSKLIRSGIIGPDTKMSDADGPFVPAHTVDVFAPLFVAIDLELASVHDEAISDAIESASELQELFDGVFGSSKNERESKVDTLAAKIEAAKGGPSTDTPNTADNTRLNTAEFKLAQLKSRIAAKHAKPSEASPSPAAQVVKPPQRPKSGLLKGRQKRRAGAVRSVEAVPPIGADAVPADGQRNTSPSEVEGAGVRLKANRVLKKEPVPRPQADAIKRRREARAADAGSSTDRLSSLRLSVGGADDPENAAAAQDVIERISELSSSGLLPEGATVSGIIKFLEVERPIKARGPAAAATQEATADWASDLADVTALPEPAVVSGAVEFLDDEDDGGAEEIVLPSEPDPPPPTLEATPFGPSPLAASVVEDSGPQLARVTSNANGDLVLDSSDDGEHEAVDVQIQKTGKGFHEDWFMLDASELRDRLSNLPLARIMGVPIVGVDLMLVFREYIARTDQLRVHPDALSDNEEELTAIADILTILQKTRTVYTDPFHLEKYEAWSKAIGRPLKFCEFVAFSPSSSLPQDAVDALGDFNPALLQSRANFEARTEARSRAEEMAAAEAAEAAREAVQRKRQEQIELFDEFGGHEHGHPFVGRLAFSVGIGNRGLLHVLPVFVAMFTACMVLVSAGQLGAGEFSLVATEPMAYLRALILAGLALFGVMVLRRERPVRVGIKPRFFATLLTIPVALGLGAVAMSLARFDLPADASVMVVAAMIAMRAVAEVLFFQAFVTRTLLIEFKDPTPAIIISSVMYGMYGLTFSNMIQGDPISVMFGVLVYGFGAGLPYALMYYRTRSVPVVILAEFIVLAGAANGGIQYALEKIGAQF